MSDTSPTRDQRRVTDISPVPGTDEAIEIRDDIGFFQAVKAALAKPRGERKSSEHLDHAVRQLVAKAIAPEGEIIDVFQAAGLKQPDISILSDQFLQEVSNPLEAAPGLIQPAMGPLNDTEVTARPGQGRSVGDNRRVVAHQRLLEVPGSLEMGPCHSHVAEVVVGGGQVHPVTRLLGALLHHGAQDDVKPVDPVGRIEEAGT